MAPHVRLHAFRLITASFFCSALLLTPSIAMGQEFVPGEVLVKLKGQTSLDTFQNKMRMHSKAGKTAVLEGSWGRFNLHKFKMKSGTNSKAFAESLKQLPEVQYAEPNYYFKSQAAGVDASSVMSLSDVRAQSSGVQSSSSFTQCSAPIQATNAWGIQSGGSFRPIVAVIDTGVDYTHDVFVDADAIWENTRETAHGNNGIDDDGNGYIDDFRGWNFVSNDNDPMDDSNHGTHVAGIVLGATQDILAATVTTSKIRIMPLKFLDHLGRGTTSDAIEAIHYALDNGAHVLNNSWGGGGYSEALRDVIVESYDDDVLFAAAAGNNSANNDASAVYPANYSIPNVISIAATNDSDFLANFSNYGASTVHVASPGSPIRSTWPNNTTANMWGTSMATPFVAGLAAMMIRENRRLTAYQLRRIITDSANTQSALSNKVSSRARINLYNAVAFAKTGDASIYAAKPPVSGSGERAVAADLAGGGCGAAIVSAAKSVGGGPGAGPLKFDLFKMLGLLVILMSPFLAHALVKRLDRSKSPHNKRRFERYHVNTEVTIKAGDREMVGHVSCISVGGARIDTSALLDKGGIVQMKILSPDGTQEIEVSGQVVWSEREKAYGVAFESVGSQVQNVIKGWTKNLSKAS